MVDITLAPSAFPTIRIRRSEWIDRVVYRVEVQRRRARRNRYLTLSGRPPGAYPWFAVIYQAMSGRY